MEYAMDTIQSMQKSFIEYLSNNFEINQIELTQCTLSINSDPLKRTFGDLNSNAPLIIAKSLKKSPREIGQKIMTEFTHPFILKSELAGAGFFNIFLNQEAFKNITIELLTLREKYFKSTKDLVKEKYSLEFVSANPTGPLHFGHGRGGIIGDVLANILQFLGHSVTREFYINDAGAQIKKLAMSLIIRCQQSLGIDVTLPEDAYHGLYLQDLAKKCIHEHGNQVLEQPEIFFENYAKDNLLKQIKQTLSSYGIEFDIWFSEQDLHLNQSINRVIETLEKKELLYEVDGALWFKSTLFGDDKDRVIRKTNGDYTYVAADIAYLKNKIDRGFNHLVMILGHDHHSYAVRLESIRKALEIKAPLDVMLYQLVKIKEGEKELRMSKRAGTMITLDDVINAVGKDVARFFYLQRKADAQLEFDLDLALKKTEENPVYYLQYAYVRIKSILEKIIEHTVLQGIYENDASNLGPEEHLVLKKIASLQSLLETIEHNHQTHLLAHYSIDLAHEFHKYYSNNRIIDFENIPKSRARLLLMMILKNTLNTLFDLLGISKPEKM